MTFCNKKCTCGNSCERQDDHGGQCDCSEHRVRDTDPAPLVTMNDDAFRLKLKLSVFVNMCSELAQLSHDPKYKVASLIVTEDFREVCAIGYNGNYKGGPNKRDSMMTGNSGFLHAEENALFHLCKAYEMRKNLVMLCTHTPCPMCAKRIVNSGINRVVYVTEYRDLGDGATEIFSIGKVKCCKFENLMVLTDSEFNAFLNA